MGAKHHPLALGVLFSFKQKHYAYGSANGRGCASYSGSPLRAGSICSMLTCQKRGERVQRSRERAWA